MTVDPTDQYEDATPAPAAPPPFSEDALALIFTERQGEDLRHVAAWNKWLLWSSTSWEPDETVYVFDLVRAICREKASESNKPLKSLATARTVAAVERLAKSDRKHAAIADQWDVNPNVFNTEEAS